MRVIASIVCGLALASCAHVSGYAPLPSATSEDSLRPLASNRFKVLYAFKAGTDGASPAAALTNVSGVLYGTTSSGGSRNDGTFFRISTSGAERVLYSFGVGTDGVGPEAGLTNVRGTLYGTTSFGGAYGNADGGGTVFSISTSGKEKVLHSFGFFDDGSEPEAGLLDVKGTLYGTTADGGAYSRGTVFSISTSGKEQVLHSFGDGADGEYPYAGLTDVNGTLYP